MKQLTQTDGQSHSVKQTHGQKATSSCHCLYSTDRLIQPAPGQSGCHRHMDTQTHGQLDARTLRPVRATASPDPFDWPPSRSNDPTLYLWQT